MKKENGKEIPEDIKKMCKMRDKTKDEINKISSEISDLKKTIIAIRTKVNSSKF